jgi:hypothetical protein
MSEIADFINAQYRRIEEAARAATDGPWSVGSVMHDIGTADVLSNSGNITSAREEPCCSIEDATHIAIHAPAAVLADIESKRAILKMFTPPEREPETDEELHARCAHPAYEYETTEGQRKTWDFADEPPWGENDEPDHTWERNVDKGIDGWERFDYTEESYWRRRLPAGQERVEEEPLVLRLLAAPFSGEPGYKEDWAVE